MVNLSDCALRFFFSLVLELQTLPLGNPTFFLEGLTSTEISATGIHARGFNAMDLYCTGILLQQTSLHTWLRQNSLQQESTFTLHSHTF